VSGRPELAVGEAFLEALRPLVAELVELELERRLAELNGPDWLTLEEAADHYRTTPVALRARARRGQLPGAVRDGSRWLVDRRAYDATLTDAATVASPINGRAPRQRPRPGTRR
jgi:hypothetical protein